MSNIDIRNRNKKKIKYYRDVLFHFKKQHNYFYFMNTFLKDVTKLFLHKSFKPNTKDLLYEAIHTKLQ